MVAKDYAERFWTLGNAIAGFGVAQNLGFAITFPVSSTYCLLMAHPELKTGLYFFYGTLSFLVLYLVAIAGCWAFKRHLTAAEDADRTALPSSIAAIFRGVVVVLFTGILLLTTAAFWSGKPGLNVDFGTLTVPIGCQADAGKFSAGRFF